MDYDGGNEHIEGRGEVERELLCEVKQSTETKMKTTNLKEALLTANKSTLKANGRKWKLDCSEVNGRFFCDAQNMTPQDSDETKFCFMDLWNSESERAINLLYKFAKLGGFVAPIESPTVRTGTLQTV